MIIGWICHPRSKKPDAMLTLSVYSLGLILFKFILSNMTIGPVVMGQLDYGVVAAILAPTLGAYTARKHSDPIKDASETNKSTGVVSEETK